MLIRPAALALDARGAALIEFALIIPMMGLFLMGSIELSRYALASGQATNLANTLAEMTSQSVTTIDETMMHRIVESAPLINPGILTYARQTERTDVWNIPKIAVTSVDFVATGKSCKGGCTHSAMVVFSKSFSGTERACGALSPSASTSYDIGKLPQSLFGPGPMTVVDVEVPYRPLFAGFFSSEATFKRSAYFRPRFVDQLRYETNCPGF